jgi:hypothetical protein
MGSKPTSCSRFCQAVHLIGVHGRVPVDPVSPGLPWLIEEKSPFASLKPWDLSWPRIDNIELRTAGAQTQYTRKRILLLTG